VYKLLHMTHYDPITALIVTDVQNDFADPNGSLYVAGGEDVIRSVNVEIAKAGEAGALIVYTMDWHPPSTPHFQKDGGIWPTHCVRDTWGAALHKDLLDLLPSHELKKGTGGEDGYSAFSVRDPETGDEAPTTLHHLLKKHAIKRVVVVGLATDYCIKETALDAGRLGYATSVVRDAIAAVNLQPDDGDQAIEAIKKAGAELV
jgi:nicotinamidase/pyrazinamidase